MLTLLNPLHPLVYTQSAGPQKSSAHKVAVKIKEWSRVLVAPWRMLRGWDNVTFEPLTLCNCMYAHVFRVMNCGFNVCAHV